MARAGLSQEAVVVEAERIADDAGLPRLTLAALADSLGVRQPSLYKHIDGMKGLQRSIAVRAKTELADTLGRAAVGRARGDAISAVARTYRQWALEHPGRYAATVRAPMPGDVEDEAASAAAVKVVLDVLSGYHLDGDAAIDATRTLRSALHGFVSLETSGGFGLPVNIDHSFERLVDALITVFEIEATRTTSGGDSHDHHDHP